MKAMFATVILLALANPAEARQCPALWKQVDAKLQTAQLSEADRSKVAALRKEGEELHGSGDHAGSAAALNEALALLD